MARARYAWQCICGNIEFTESQPEDCSKCLRVGEFERIPEDLVEERTEEEILSPNEEDLNDENDKGEEEYEI